MSNFQRSPVPCEIRQGNPFVEVKSFKSLLDLLKLPVSIKRHFGYTCKFQFTISSSLMA
jgi:hypothetical protein